MHRNLWIRIFFPVLIVLFIICIFWNWDWFIPVVDAQARAALGRKVTITHLHVRLGGTTTVAADGITVTNPDHFPADEKPLATIDRLRIQVDVWDYITHQTLDLTTIELDHPVASVRQLPDGENNYTLNSPGGTAHGKPPRLGDLIINKGTASVIVPGYKTNFDLLIQTRPAPAGDKLFTGGEIVVDAHGTYAGAPITGRFIGGALLSLRDPSIPYPIDLHVQNGTSLASLAGTVEDPAHFAGAHLRLSLSGQNMADLYQLTGVPIPATPPFRLTGKLDYAQNSFRFENFAGKVGSSDLEGTITEAPGRHGGW
jgi:uncharacterized protein involved in outer membrane biogenesis